MEKNGKERKNDRERNIDRKREREREEKKVAVGGTRAALGGVTGAVGPWPASC